jgi:hypothetical protein
MIHTLAESSSLALRLSLAVAEKLLGGLLLAWLHPVFDYLRCLSLLLLP